MSISKNYVKFEFLSQKTLFLGQKVWKKFGKFGNRVSEHSEILEIVLFRTFQKLRKNDVKLKLRKSRKTRSNSKVRLKVWNAGPQLNQASAGTLSQFEIQANLAICGLSIRCFAYSRFSLFCIFRFFEQLPHLFVIFLL